MTNHKHRSTFTIT